MNKPLIVSAIILVANSGCASERLYVKVIDELGRPVTNAVVAVAVPPATAFGATGYSPQKGSRYQSFPVPTAPILNSTRIGICIKAR